VIDDIKTLKEEEEEEEDEDEEGRSNCAPFRVKIPLDALSASGNGPSRLGNKLKAIFGTCSWKSKHGNSSGLTVG